MKTSYEPEDQEPKRSEKTEPKKLIIPQFGSKTVAKDNFETKKWDRISEDQPTSEPADVDVNVYKSRKVEISKDKRNDDARKDLEIRGPSGLKFHQQIERATQLESHGKNQFSMIQVDSAVTHDPEATVITVDGSISKNKRWGTPADKTVQLTDARKPENVDVSRNFKKENTYHTTSEEKHENLTVIKQTSKTVRQQSHESVERVYSQKKITDSTTERPKAYDGHYKITQTTDQVSMSSPRQDSPEETYKGKKVITVGKQKLIQMDNAGTAFVNLNIHRGRKEDKENPRESASEPQKTRHFPGQVDGAAYVDVSFQHDVKSQPISKTEKWKVEQGDSKFPKRSDQRDQETAFVERQPQQGSQKGFKWNVHNSGDRRDSRTSRTTTSTQQDHGVAIVDVNVQHERQPQQGSQKGFKWNVQNAGDRRDSRTSRTTTTTQQDHGVAIVDVNVEHQTAPGNRWGAANNDQQRSGFGRQDFGSTSFDVDAHNNSVIQRENRQGFEWNVQNTGQQSRRQQNHQGIIQVDQMSASGGPQYSQVHQQSQQRVGQWSVDVQHNAESKYTKQQSQKVTQHSYETQQSSSSYQQSFHQETKQYGVSQGEANFPALVQKHGNWEVRRVSVDDNKPFGTQTSMEVQPLDRKVTLGAKDHNAPQRKELMKEFKQRRSFEDVTDDGTHVKRTIITSGGTSYDKPGSEISTRKIQDHIVMSKRS
ncbi:uncharacterized protein LOC116306929 [Actinia tenebrosa]|uniref:Uncharacterized protein LOC116306929 n=1 Tax=Actinia tenebrosa TaxID=6105 RepID=A0A6P8J6L0_ACTTE|nr:uncharacterized protein LOC116306929 [Actinia tenebrosa]